jgi:calcium/calmodulin-dependent protein kinase I
MAAVQTFTRRKDPIEQFYNIDTKLGSGAFSTVFRATPKPDGNPVAVKIIQKEGQMKRVLLVENEIKCWSCLRHPAIVTLFEVFDMETQFCLVQEIVTGGELFDRIVEKQFYSERDACSLLRQIVAGVQHMHQRGVIHRDLKPENLLLSDKTDEARVLVADFGLAATSEDTRRLKKPVGTPGYIAPEVIKCIDDEPSSVVSFECDIWAVGVILYILLCGFPPFDIEDEQKGLEEAVNANYTFPADAWDVISDSVKDLIRRILVVDRTQRLTAQQILEHPWVAQGADRGDNLSKVIEQMSKFNARRKWRKAINATRALKRFQVFSKKK